MAGSENQIVMLVALVPSGRRAAALLAEHLTEEIPRQSVYVTNRYFRAV